MPYALRYKTIDEGVYMFRAITACMVGNAFEWYDFALYAYFATTIGHLFFPDADPLTSLISTYAILAAGYAIRPLGAVIFGHIGDRFGRKKALVLCIFLMTVPTFIIGLLPTYNQIGIWAPIILASLRLLQGLSVGGNFGGAVTFITEYAPQNRRGFIGSWSVVSILSGMIIGSGIATIINAVLTPEQVMSWGWRLPFIGGIFLGAVGFYMRFFIPETPEFEKEKKAHHDVPSPFKYIIQHKRKEMLFALLIILLNDVGFYTMFAFFTSYLHTALEFTLEQALRLNTINMFIMILLIPIAGWLSDKVGRKIMIGTSALIFATLSYPLFLTLNGANLVWVWFIQFVFAIALSCYFGPMSALLVEMFPTKGRYSAISFSLSTSAAIFGGTAPLVGTFLVKMTGLETAPAFYLTIAGVVTLVATFFIKDRYKEALA